MPMRAVQVALNETYYLIGKFLKIGVKFNNNASVFF